jgi:subtilase family serine protease
MTKRWGILVTACVLAVGTAVAAHPAGAAPAHRLAGSQPAWAQRANKVGTVAPATGITFRVYLHGRDDAGLAAFAAAVADPASPQYGHYLTAAQVRDRFAPAAATVASVANWLRSNGLAVTEVPANNLYVEANGSAARIAKTFGVTLSSFRVKGKVLRAPDSELNVPSSLSSAVAGVIGVDQSQSLMKPRAAAPAPPSDGFRNAPPCSTSWGSAIDTIDPPYGGGYGKNLPYAPCGLTPPQLRKAYGLSSTVDAGHTGASATVAIIDAYASPTIFEDASRYAALHDSTHPLLASQFSQILPTNPTMQGPNQCDASGWYGEETLDVEAVHAMAPGAHILYVGANDCLEGLDKALNDVIANHRAQIITNSWGEIGEEVPLSEIVAYAVMTEQAVAQGIGVYFSSGDDGDETDNLPQPEADFPGSLPTVTAVGGTSLGVNANGTVALETGWSTGISSLAGGTYSPPAPGEFLYGSGGGTSMLFGQPAYQQGVVPASLANANGKPPARVVPDMSLVGDPNTGMLVGQTQKFPGKEGVHYDEYRIGGTSLSSPLLAGVVALADDLQGKVHGFINPSIYSKVRKANGLRDIKPVKAAVVRVDYVNGIDARKGTSTSVRTFNFPQTIATTNGYDRVTGLGVPAGLAFLNSL